MDNSETHGSNRNALRQPFIDTANALASLYKQSVAAERDARDAGSRMAYQRIIQWAAKKSRSGEPLSAADVVSFCATELAQLPNNPPSSDRTTNSPPQSSPPISTSQARNQDSEMPNCNAPPVAYVARDDALVSDIKKLHVNPRKRQRVDISDAFIRACSGEENAFVFSPDHLYALQNHDNSSNALSAQNALHASQQNTHQSKKDAKDGRDMFVHHTSGNDYNSRKPRNPKMHMDLQVYSEKKQEFLYFGNEHALKVEKLSERVLKIVLDRTLTLIESRVLLSLHVDTENEMDKVKYKRVK